MKPHLPKYWAINWLLLIFWTSVWLISITGKALSQNLKLQANLNLNSIIYSSTLETVNSNLFLTLIAIWLGVFLGLTWWMRQTALQSKSPDKTAIWYSYQRFFQWLINGIWLGWLALIFMGEGKLILDIYFAQLIKDQDIINLCFYFLPPATITVICYTLSYPVFARVRGMEWTQKELIEQAILGQMTNFFPWIAVIVSIEIMLADQLGLSIAYLVLAGVSYIVFLPLWAKSQDLTPHALTTGELRDRIFYLAQQAGVKLQQIYILPTGKSRLANAFANINNNLLLGEYLLEHLNKREVDAIIAHELGHLKLKHPQKLTNITFWLSSITIFGVAFLMFSLKILPPWLAFILLFFSLTYANYFFSRRFEYAADAEAVVLLQDPQACITALTKLTRLNLMPMEWGKLDIKLTTHPSLLNRAKAIAKLGEISPQKLIQIINTAETDQEYYVLPPIILNPEKVFSTTFKSQITQRLSWLNLAVKIITPTAVAFSIKFVTITSFQPYIYFAGCLLTILIFLGVNNWFGVWGHKQIKRKLQAKLEQEGILVDQWQGIFVGFAPDDKPRIYEGFLDWDLGFVFLTCNSLYYLGEQTSFTLQTNQVTTINLGSGFPNWWKSPRVYLSWRDQEQITAGTFNFAPAEVKSLQQLETKIRPFKQQLQNWWERSTDFFIQLPDNIALPQAVKQLTIPSTLTVTGTSPQEALKNSKLLGQISLNCILGFGMSWLLPLPDLSEFYIIFTACLTTIFSLIPLWRYRSFPLGTFGNNTRGLALGDLSE